MTKRLLTELFPHFVKKAQTQQLAKGPFGEGLLEKQGKRVYLKPGQQAPEGVQVQTGPKGGKYYDVPGGGGAAAAEDYGYPGEPGQVEGAAEQAMADWQEENVGETPMTDYAEQDAMRARELDAEFGDAEGVPAFGDPEDATPKPQFSQEEFDAAYGRYQDDMADRANQQQGGTGSGRDPNIEAGGVPNPLDYSGYGENWEVDHQNPPMETDIDGMERSNAEDDGPGIVEVPGLHGAADPITSLQGGGQWNETRMKPVKRGETTMSSDYVEAWRGGAGGAKDFEEKMSEMENWDEERIISDLTAQGYDIGVGKERSSVPGEGKKPAKTGEGAFKEYDPGKDPVTGDYQFEQTVLNIDLPDKTKPTLAAAMRRDLEQQGFKLEPPPTGPFSAAYKPNEEFLDDAIEAQRPATYDIGGVTMTEGQPATPEQEQALEAQRQASLEGQRPATYDIGSKAGSEPNPQTLDSPAGLDWERSGFDQEDLHDAIIEAEGPYGSDSGMSADGAKTWMEENRIDPDSSLGAKLYDYADTYSRERAQESAWDYGGEYTLMEKRMQKYNVDNRRRDPIVLSNKGGRQRR